MQARYAAVFLLLALLVVLALLEGTVLIRAWALHREARFADEIAWLESWEPVRVWEPGRHAAIDRRYVDRLQAELLAGRLDHAAVAARLARRRFRSEGRGADPQLLALGVEVCMRAVDRLQRSGRLSAAADWDDSLFVLAVRAGEARMRNAALAAFTEGLDLRVRDGRPCDALARVGWARRGLGGTIPGFAPDMERQLETRCESARRGGGTR